MTTNSAMWDKKMRKLTKMPFFWNNIFKNTIILKKIKIYYIFLSFSSIFPTPNNSFTFFKLFFSVLLSSSHAPSLSLSLSYLHHPLSHFLHFFFFYIIFVLKKINKKKVTKVTANGDETTVDKTKMWEWWTTVVDKMTIETVADGQDENYSRQD